MRILFALIALAVALHARPAEACSCLRPEGPQAELAKFDAVFEGEVTAIAGDEMERKVTLSVKRAWKGVDSPTIEVATAGSSAACGFSFERGKSYLLYAETIEGALRVGLCSRSQLIEGAAEDLAALGTATYQGAGSAGQPEEPNEPNEPDVPEPNPSEPMVPIEPPPPPPAPRDAGGCAGCAMSGPLGGWTSGAPIFLLGLMLLFRRRVVS